MSQRETCGFMVRYKHTQGSLGGYAILTPAKANVSHLLVTSPASIDAEIAEAENSLASGAVLFIGGHGGAANYGTSDGFKNCHTVRSIPYAINKLASIMEKAFDFLSRHKDVAFATVEDGMPKIRIFEIMKQQGNTLYFATASWKEVYRQLQENPNVEILAMNGNIFVRIAGQAVFDVDDATAREIYAANPVLPRLYKAYTDLVYFRLSAATLDYYDLAPDPPLQEHYDYGQKR